MKSSIRQTLPGPFSTCQLNGEVWQLAPPAPAASRILLRLDTPGTSQALQSAHITRLEVEWGPHGATVALIAAGEVRRLQVRTAIIHEPRPSLYENLPLAAFDPKARRFWRRVFTVMRIPGGRLLLGILARRNR